MKTILIVEDTEDYAENIRFLLTQAGYNVVVAADGGEGFETAMRIKPDLILMDVMMPVQDGVQTTALLRQQPSLKEVPVIFLTAVTAGESVRMDVDGQDYPTISKMTDMSKLLDRIRQYLGKNP